MWDPKFSNSSLDQCLSILEDENIELPQDVIMSIFCSENGDLEKTIKLAIEVWKERDNPEKRQKYNMESPINIEWWWAIERDELRRESEDEEEVDLIIDLTSD